MKCKECKGRGEIELFTSVEPCNICEGSGEVRRWTFDPGSIQLRLNGEIQEGPITAVKTSTTQNPCGALVQFQIRLNGEI